MSVGGSCLCGAVRFRVDGPLRDVIACHCNQCRKQTGHFCAATNAADDDLTIDGQDNITWFHASPEARRGFCKHCGSSLFWKPGHSENTSILAGSLNHKSGVKLTSHIYVADKGDYYELEDDLPKYAGDRSDKP